MTKRTRYFLIGSAVVVSIGLGTGLVAYYKGDLTMFRSRVGPEELAYVPADVTGLAYANVREIMDSEFRQKLREVLPSGRGKDEFLSETGIDIERDIQSVVAAVGVGNPTDHPLVFIRGNFDQARIEAMVRQHNGTFETYKGKQLMMPGTPGERRPDSPCLAFVEPGLAMVGTDAAIRRAIDTRETSTNVTGNAELMKLVGNLHGAGNTAWAVSNLGAVMNNPGVPQQIRDQLPGMEWVSIGAHVNGGLNGRIRAQAKDDKAAADLRAVVNGALAAGRLMGGKNPEIEPFLNSIQVSGGGKDVDLAFNLPPAMLDMIGGLAVPRRAPMAPRMQLN